MSFKASVFDELSGFNTDFGKDHDLNLQGEDAEICARMASEFGEGVYYLPDAAVSHKVYAEQLTPSWLLDRSYWQGYTKWKLSQTVEESTETENEYLAFLFTTALPRYLKETIQNLSHVPLVKAIILLAFTAAVGVGYIHGAIRESF
jgi:GT2 family glycosyltransferase